MSEIILAFGFGLVTSSIIALGAVGFTLQFSVTNIFNLSYGSVMTLCAFVGYWVAIPLGVGIWPGVLAATIVGAIASVALNTFLYTPFIKRGTTVFAMVIVTSAVSVIMQYGIQAVAGVDFYSFPIDDGSPIEFLGMSFTAQQLAIIGLAVAAMLGLHALLTRTRLGKAIRATAEDESLALGCGISTRSVVAIVWTLSGALCGMAGMTLVLNTVTFAADSGASFLLIVVSAAIVGGVGSPYGAMGGALVIGIGTEIVALYAPDLKEFVAFGLLVLILVWRRPSWLPRPFGRRPVPKEVPA